MIPVSVVIPTCNRAALLQQAIGSVMEQTLRDFELIVVDDGSTDATAQAVQGFDDSRIVYLRQQHGGRSTARNRGIEAAQGEMISFLDDDDRYLPDKLALQYDFLTARPDLDGVASGTHLVFEDRQVVRTSEPWHAGAPLKLADWLIINRFCPWAAMIRRTVLEGWGPWFDPVLDYAEDAAFYIRLAQRGVRMEWLREPVYEYRLYGERPSQYVVAYQMNFHKVTERVLNDPEAPQQVVSQRHRIRAERDLWAALRLCHAGAGGLAATALSRAMLENPALFDGWRPPAVEIVARYVSEHVVDNRPAFLSEWLDCLPPEACAMHSAITRLQDDWADPVRHYRAFGLNIGSEIKLCENESDAGQAELRIRRRRTAANECGNSEVQHAIVSVTPWGVFSSCGGREITVDPAMDPTDPVMVSFLMEKMTPLALMQRGALVFHATVIALGKEAVALMGPPRIGKTTLALTLIRDAGARLLDDDILAAWPGREEIVVEPGWGIVKLWPETAQRFGLDPATLERQYPGTDKRIWPGASTGGQAASLRGVILIEQDDIAAMERPDPATAVEALQRHWYGLLYDELFQAAGGAAAMRRQSVALAQSVKTWRLTLDRQFETPGSVVGLVAEALNVTMEIR